MTTATRPLEAIIADLRYRIDSLERRLDKKSQQPRDIEMRRGRLRSIANPVRNQDATPKMWVEDLVADLIGGGTPGGPPVTGEEIAIVFAMLLS